MVFLLVLCFQSLLYSIVSWSKPFTGIPTPALPGIKSPPKLRYNLSFHSYFKQHTDGSLARLVFRNSIDKLDISMPSSLSLVLLSSVTFLYFPSIHQSLSWKVPKTPSSGLAFWFMMAHHTFVGWVIVFVFQWVSMSMSTEIISHSSLSQQSHHIEQKMCIVNIHLK